MDAEPYLCHPLPICLSLGVTEASVASETPTSGK